MKKQYCKTSEEIIRILPDIGAALVTDRIAVDGERVGYMTRLDSHNQADSGWVFYAGDETQEYLDDSRNTSVMALNTIANFDFSILPFLMFPPGTQVERSKNGELQAIGAQDNEPNIRFLLPAFPGLNRLTQSWEVQIQEHLLRRIEKGELIMWRPGLTFYVTCFVSNDQDERALVADFMTDISKNAENLFVERSRSFTQIRYDLIESVEGQEQKGVYISGFSDGNVIHIAAYYDQEPERTIIQSFARSLRFRS
ncbi:MAG: DUF2185 domain-containing protein [Spirulina sp. SIO3F2]|nr:DUF2185 domain-containing protein [Spirulina sp. SIO3F2]